MLIQNKNFDPIIPDKRLESLLTKSYFWDGKRDKGKGKATVKIALALNKLSFYQNECHKLQFSGYTPLNSRK